MDPTKINDAINLILLLFQGAYLFLSMVTHFRMTISMVQAVICSTDWLAVLRMARLAIQQRNMSIGGALAVATVSTVQAVDSPLFDVLLLEE